ncbi:MAG: hypothetical protein RBJ76_13795 [Stenomitos frigidus ULC029]
MKKLIHSSLCLLLASVALEARADYVNPDIIDVAFTSDVMTAFLDSEYKAVLFDSPPRRLILIGMAYCKLRRAGIPPNNAVKRQVEHAWKEVESDSEMNIIGTRIIAVSQKAPKYYCPEIKN